MNWNMSFKLFMITFVFSVAAQLSLSTETVGEKINSNANDVKRDFKKGAHRLDEATCIDKDVKCFVKKAKNRSTELKDGTVDGAKKIKNKID